jgi:hypothetical protein
LSGKQKTGSTKGNVEFDQVATKFTQYSDVKRGRVFRSENVLSVNGKIFAMLTGDNKFVVKLPEDKATALVGRGIGNNWAPGNRKPMKEWVSITPGKTISLFEITQQAYEYVKGKAR